MILLALWQGLIIEDLCSWEHHLGRMRPSHVPRAKLISQVRGPLAFLLRGTTHRSAIATASNVSSLFTLIFVVATPIPVNSVAGGVTKLNK
jgi:hypothetical protein